MLHHSFFTIVVLLTIFHAIGNVHNATIQINDDYKFKGKADYLHVIYNGQCHNIPQSWKNRVSAVSTGGICVDLFAERNCMESKRIRLYPGNYSHDNLTRWDFDKMLKSMKACKKHINGTNDGSLGNSVAIFDGTGFTGEYFNLNVDSCRNLPEIWRNRTSATVTFNKCYKYFAGLNCTDEYIVQSLDTPFHDNFTKRNFDDMTNSIGICESETFDTTMESVSTVQDNIVTQFTTHGSELPTFVDPSLSSTPGLKQETVVIVSVSVVVIILLVLLICGMILLFNYFRKRTDINSMGELQLQLLNQRYIKEFMDGNPSAYDNIEYDQADASYRAQNMSYDAELYEIPLEYLRIDRKCPLGSGEYGTVSKAVLASPKFAKPFDVAVKMVKTGADPGYVKALLAELKVMIYLTGKDKANQHAHVVNLIGACTQRIYKLEPYIILEFCSQGSLVELLRKNRKTFTNRIGQYERSLAYQGNPLYVNDQSLDTIQLTKWSCEIADGMDFLSSKKVIHGDLAARNILLDDRLNAKISDFGLSRQLYQYTQYVKKQQAPLPWRWMAIESLQDMTFSSQSDVWALGVTLWEIFTLAEMPFPGIMWSPHFITTLKDGYRMKKPKYATPEIFNIMKKCWEEVPDKRPKFVDIRTEFANILESFTQ